MKKWEMIKMLTEDSNKIFKTKIKHGYAIASNVQGKVIYSNDGDDNYTLEYYQSGINAVDSEWEEVKQPYTFEKAYKMCWETKESFENEFGDKLLIAPNRKIAIKTKDSHNWSELDGAWYKL